MKKIKTQKNLKPIISNGMPLLSKGNSFSSLARKTTQFRIPKCIFFLLFYVLSSPGLVYGQACGTTDNDGDGVFDLCDLDDDNDGILDSQENICDMSAVSNIVSGTGLHTDQVYIFNWDGSDFTDGLQTGDSQVFTLSDGTIITADFTNVFTNGGSLETAPFQTWPGAFLYQLYDSGLGQESFYGAAATQDFTVTLALSATKNGQTFPLSLLALDSESTNKNIQEDWSVTTNGSNWEVLDVFGGGGVWTGVGTDKVTTTNTEQSGGNTIFISDNVTELTWNVTSQGTRQQAFAIGIFLNCDTDGNGIIDALDPDSDNDGCSDALEGAGGFTYADIMNDTLTGGVDVDGIPIAATSSGQAIGTSQDASVQAAECDPCNSASTLFVDTDGDLIGDECDLDDDNDGILDEVECPPATQPTNYATGYTSVTGAMLGVANGSTDVNVTGDISSTFGLPTGSVIVQVINGLMSGASWKVEADKQGGTTDFIFTGTHQVYMYHNHGGNLVAGGSDGVESLDGTTYTFTESATLPSDWTSYTNGSQYFVTNESGGTGTNLMRWISDGIASDVRIYTTSNAVGAYAIKIGIVPPCPDTDGDGIADYLDVDADGDGCSDALEGDGSFTFSDIDSNNMLTGGVDADGIPIVAAGGQGVGESTNTAIADCECPLFYDQACTVSLGNIGTLGQAMDGTEAPYTATPNCILVDNDEAINYRGFMVGCAQNQCPISLTEPTGGLTTFDPVLACPNEEIEYIVPLESDAVYLQYWSNCVPTVNGLPVVTAANQGFVNQLFCDVDVNGHIMAPASLGTPQAGVVSELPATGARISVMVAELDPTTTCAGSNPDMELIQSDFWILVPEYITEIGFSLGGGAADASMFMVGTDVTNMCTTAEFLDGAGAGTEGVAESYYTISCSATTNCSGKFLRARLYTTDIAIGFNTTPQLNFGAGFEDLDAAAFVTVYPATGPDDNVPPTILYDVPAPGFADADGNIFDANGDYIANACLDSVIGDACSTMAENDINQTPQDVPVDGNILTNDSDPTDDPQTVQSATGLDAAGMPIMIPIDGTPTPIYDENGVLAGTIAMMPDGSYTYDPAPGYTGTIPVEYVVVDSNGDTDTATLDIDVIPADDPTQNDPPIANDDTNTTEQDVNVSGEIMSPNDSDPEGDVLTVTAATGLDAAGMPITISIDGTPTDVYDENGVLAGTMALNPDGTYDFDPEPTFTGEVPVDYTIDDGNGGTDTATLTITVEPDLGNDTYANDDSNVGEQGAPQTGNVVTNDNDPEGDPQTISGGTTADGTPIVPGTPVPLPSGGMLTLNPDGSYDYTPDPDFVGTEVIVYEVCDDQTPPACEEATLYLTTLPVNETVAENDINQTPMDTPVDGNILTNDTDEEGDAQTVQSATGLDATGAPINIPLDGTPTDVYDENGVLAGTMAMMPDGSYTFDPAPGFTGEVPVDYVVVDAKGATDTASLAIEVLPITDPSQNNPPVANDDTNTTEMDVNVSGEVITANDSDPDGDPLTIPAALADTDGDGIVDEPLVIGLAMPIFGTDCDGNTVIAGTMKLNADGTYDFNPTATFKGEVSIDYTIEDPSGLSDDATLTITIEPDTGNDTYANDDANSGNAGDPQAGNILDNDNDPEGDPQLVTGATDAAGNPIVPGTPATLPSGGTFTINADGSYDYTPDPNFVGTEVIVYEVCDDQTPAACEEATLYLTTLPVNTITAEEDFNNTPMDTPVNGSVATNDPDAEGDILTFTPVGTDGGMPASEGTVTFNPDGSYLFTPAPGFSGETEFDYEVCDDGTPALCETTTLYIEVFPEVDVENPMVIANPDANTVAEGQTGTGDIMANDLDPDAISPQVTTPLSGAIVPGVDEDGNPVANAGTLTINPDGTYSFTPAPGFTGVVTQPYTICDAVVPATCDDSELVIDVIPSSDNATFANDDAAITDVGVMVPGDVFANDTDGDGDTETLTEFLVDTDGDGVGDTPGIPGTPTTIGGLNDMGVFVANAGTMTLNPDGTYEFTPDPGFVGNVNVPYTKCDDGTPQACDDATLVITIQDVRRDYGDAPVAYPVAWHRALSDSDGDEVLDGGTDVWLGTKTDFESTQLVDAGAAGDTNDDAITFGSGPGEFPLLATPGQVFSLDIVVNSTGPDLVFYGLWIDWDNDGVYDNFYDGFQTTASPTTTSVDITAPPTEGLFSANIRLRADDEPFVDTDFEGGKTNGEVEDYQASVALPIELISFEGSANECEVNLKWSTAAATNFSHFEIERSENGNDGFITIGSIEYNNNTTNTEYNFTDTDLRRSNFYRLKMIDLDGSFAYSEILPIQVECEEWNDIKLYPNPVSVDLTSLNVEFYSPTEKEVQVTIVDYRGVEAMASQSESATGINIIELDIANLPAGIYILNINTGLSAPMQKRFVKI